MTQTNNRLYATDFEGNKLYERNASGNAKFLPSQSDKIFVAGAKASVVDLQTGQTLFRVNCHDNVTSFAFITALDLVVVGSDDCSWSLHDIAKQLLLTKIKTEEAVTAIEFHPDCLVLGVGLANGKVLLYDIRT